MRDARGFVLLVDKAGGPTSHDIVQRARRALGQRKIGHAGTLDPFATGLLVLCVGQATRLVPYLTGLDKVYEATARLGVTTDTLDLDGEVVSEDDAWRGLSDEAIRSAARAQVGEIDQVPPRFSAKKIDGESAHRRARRGEEVELEPSRVTVHELEVLATDLPDIRFRVRCSKGTYIRAIARDLGVALEVGAHLTELRRTSIGDFSVEEAVASDALDDADAVEAARVEPLEALDFYPSLSLTDDLYGAVSNGQRPSWPEPIEEGVVRLEYRGHLVSVAEIEGGTVRPVRVFPLS